MISSGGYWSALECPAAEISGVRYLWNAKSRSLVAPKGWWIYIYIYGMLPLALSVSDRGLWRSETCRG